MQKFKIAIDGPAASGKSTTAKILAEKLGYLYIDTGAMYRALTLAVLQGKINIQSRLEIIEIAKKSKIELIQQKNELRTLLNGEDVSVDIRKPEVNEIISIISAYAEVREIMVEKQQKLAESGGVVMDGRDIGTVVLKDAEIKIFMKADLDERAQRRYNEFQLKGIKSSLERIRTEIQKRDEIDSSRAASPLKPAKDAHVVDTSKMTISEQVETCLNIIREFLTTNDDNYDTLTL